MGKWSRTRQQVLLFFAQTTARHCTFAKQSRWHNDAKPRAKWNKREFVAPDTSNKRHQSIGPVTDWLKFTACRFLLRFGKWFFLFVSTTDNRQRKRYGNFIFACTMHIALATHCTELKAKSRCVSRPIFFPEQVVADAAKKCSVRERKRRIYIFIRKIALKSVECSSWTDKLFWVGNSFRVFYSFPQWTRSLTFHFHDERRCIVRFVTKSALTGPMSQKKWSWSSSKCAFSGKCVATMSSASTWRLLKWIETDCNYISIRIEFMWRLNPLQR